MHENTIRYFKPQNENDALLPCPFCGGNEIYYEEYKTTVGRRFCCWCASCMASIDPGYAQDRYTVRRMWNRRTATS